MRMLLITVLLVFVVGACGLVFDSKVSSTEHLPDAGTTDDPQHDGGSYEPPDGGCNPGDAGLGGDGGSPPDGGYAPDGGWWPPPDAGGYVPDAGQ